MVTKKIQGVKSVQLGKTLSFVKFVVEWGGVEGCVGGGETLDHSSLTRGLYTKSWHPVMPRTILNFFCGGWW